VEELPDYPFYSPRHVTLLNGDLRYPNSAHQVSRELLKYGLNIPYSKMCEIRSILDLGVF
jgi:hypothetical protein